MTPQELKNSILQLAVQGKLVPQLPEEGTAEELYTQIQEEKQRLIEDGKIKKEKPLPEITEDEIPFAIPESWKWVRFGNLGNYKKGPFGSALTKNMFVPKGNEAIKVYEQKNAIQKDITLGNYYIKREYFESKMKGFEVFAGDIIVSCAGTIGETYVIPDTFEQGIINQALMRMRIFAPMYIPYFLLYFDSAIKINAQSGSKGSAIKNIPPFEKLKNYLVPLPPLSEQKRIVAKIEELLPYIDRYEKAWGKLEDFNKRFPGDMQKSVLQMAIQGKLVEQRPEEGTGEELFTKLQPYSEKLKPCKNELDFSAMDFDVPHNWRWVELNQIFDFVDYRGKTPYKISEGVFLITASNIKNGYMDYTRKEYISKEEYETRKSRGVTHKGDLLFTTEAPLGNTAICDLDECSCGQRIITFQEYEANTIIPKLFMYFILSPSFQKQLLDNCTGTTAKGIKSEKLKHLLIPLPPLAEQKRIVEKLEEILPLCKKLK